MNNQSIFDDIYRGKRILLTGDTGFKGSWLAFWLSELGADVTGLALPPVSQEGSYVKADIPSVIKHVDQDIRARDEVARIVCDVQPDVVFHLAAQALVRESYQNPVETVETNIMGTVNLLDAVRVLGKPCSIVVVTSDKCYENREWVYPYRENDSMGGYDVYSASKGCVELMCSAYRRSFFNEGNGVFLGTARAGNVIGPGDWAVDRIVPDTMRSFRNGETLIIRNPHAIRPWQHVLEPLAGYLRLGERLLLKGDEYAEAWNFGPYPDSARTVGELIAEIRKECSDGKYQVKSSIENPHEAHFLKLSIDKAIARLGWHPTWGFEETIKRTVKGYHKLMEAKTVDECRRFLSNEIADYLHDYDKKS